jgi:hypothetical protein
MRDKLSTATLVLAFAIALHALMPLGAQTIGGVYNEPYPPSGRAFPLDMSGGNLALLGLGAGVPDANHPLSTAFNINGQMQDLWNNTSTGVNAFAERCTKTDTSTLCFSQQGPNYTALASVAQRGQLYNNCGAGCTNGTPGIDLIACAATTPTTCFLRFSTNNGDPAIGERARISAVGLIMAGSTLIQNGSTTQANLATTLTANGQMIYCSDCTIANPCAAAGTGALAKRLNGVNVCN